MSATKSEKPTRLTTPSERPARKRAVCLTSSGLEILNARLLDRWREETPQRRLTREIRAALMDVSVATAQKILAKEGVDRTTLIHAFAKLGVPWDDRFCERKQLSKSQTPPTLLPHSGHRFPRALWLTAGATAAAVIVATLSMSLASRSSSPRLPDSHSSSEEAEAITKEAIDAYNAADFARANRLSLRLLQISQHTQYAGGVATALRTLGDVAAARGDYKLAVKRLSEALYQRRLVGDIVSEPSILEALASSELELGEVYAARQHLQLCLTEFENLHDATGQAMACRGLLTVEQRSGKLGAAEEWFKRALRILKGHPNEGIRQDLLARHALCLRDLGKVDEARQQLRSCLSYWREQNHPRWIATTLYQLATVETAAGEQDRARALLADSEMRFESLADRGGIANCDRLLLSLRRSAASGENGWSDTSATAFMQTTRKQ